MRRLILTVPVVLYSISILSPIVQNPSYMYRTGLTIRLIALAIGLLLGWFVAWLGTRYNKNLKLYLIVLSATTLLQAKNQLNDLGMLALNRSPDYSAFILALMAAIFGMVVAFNAIKYSTVSRITLVLLVQLNLYLLISPGFN